MKDDEVFVCLERAVRNMAHQELTPEHGMWNKLADLPGD
jgi:hypothetical protein